MPINSRTKGAAFERLMVNKINSYLEAGNYSARVKRNLDQTYVKGLADIYLGDFAIECKRYGKSNTGCYRNAWWKQVTESASDKFIPILIYKYDRKKIMCVVPMWLVTQNAPKDNDMVYMTPLEELCKDFNSVMAKGNVHPI